MRLAKYLAEAGIASRRKAEDIIIAGRVTVDGKVIADVATNITNETIVVDGKIVSPEKKIYYLLNKPVGVTSTTDDPHADKIITDLVPKKPKVWPVGRLDRETSGLIILTNDGELTQRLTHPSYKKTKEYEIIVDRPLSIQEQERLERGVVLEDGPFKPDKFKELSGGKYYIAIHEGRNRLLRRAISHFGKEITTLTRVKIGPIGINGLKQGNYRVLTKNELESL